MLFFKIKIYKMTNFLVFTAINYYFIIINIHNFLCNNYLNSTRICN